MNCIFCCVFTQEKYVEMFLLLESSLNLIDTEIVVYTSSEFMNKIKVHQLNENIIFNLNDSYNTIDKACKAKLDFFNLPSIQKYNKVLYLDTDIIVRDINNIFDVCKENVIYAFGEGEINHYTDFWGKSLFCDESINSSAFSCGVLLFNNCETIKNLFEKIKDDMGKRSHYFCDQPFIVYNAFKENLYNNTELEPFVTNTITSDKPIYHSAGGPGDHLQKKINNMIERINFITNKPKPRETTVIVGTSNENTKSIKLKERILVGHNLINEQDHWWRDTFDIRIIKDELIVKRTDTSNGGWGQYMILPIKYNKVLIYNGFPFHYEKIGFMLDFCKHFSIEVDILLTHDSSWTDFYKTHYKFTILNELPADYNHYLFVFLISENDPTFPLHLINENIVCFKNERIKNQVDALPIFRHISLNDKLSILNKQSKPIISFMDSSPDLSIYNLTDYNVYIINKHITGQYNLPNVFLFEDVSASKLVELLTQSSYIYSNDENWIPMSFSTGCKFIKFISKDTTLESPSLFEVFNEREKLLHSRDKSIFDLKHMKLFLDFKTVNWIG